MNEKIIRDLLDAARPIAKAVVDEERALELEKVDQEEKELGIKEVKNTIDKIMYYNNSKDKILKMINEIVK